MISEILFKIQLSDQLLPCSLTIILQILITNVYQAKTSNQHKKGKEILVNIFSRCSRHIHCFSKKLRQTQLHAEKNKNLTAIPGASKQL